MRLLIIHGQPYNNNIIDESGNHAHDPNTTLTNRPVCFAQHFEVCTALRNHGRIQQSMEFDLQRSRRGQKYPISHLQICTKYEA